MLRLAASHPPLWRTPSTVQLGPDDTRPLEGVNPWQERLLDELVTGIPDARFAPLARELGASDDEAASFLDRIHDALAPAPTRPTPVRVELPVDLPRDDEATLVAGLTAAGVEPVEVERWAPAEAGERLPVLLVAHHLADPRRTARLVADDVPHLVLELSGERVQVGPLVTPGASACLACVHAARRDADPEWPLVAAQLLGRPAPPTARILLLEGAILAARLLTTGETGRSAVLTAEDARRDWREHPPHAQCLCRSPEGNATADAPVRPMPATSSVTGFARPA
ncbi:hypothetical protein BKA24_001601 [Microbacterium marinum]|uniref:Bacteriocin biosynthesis cyclodehydratase domain-containing protein n=1 Tax=Microbacterium marinum TaxID=421115 RepID=A0A7W7FIB8_9MICO|nr:hypothetical protein [Microbacterium marinum]